MGNQNFDVKVDSNRSDIPQYIEIVVANRDGCENARMEIFLRQGYAGMTGDVLIERSKKLGKKIIVDEEMQAFGKINQKAKNRINELVNKKTKVQERPQNTALLVFFDDYTAFRYDLDESKSEMDKFLDSMNIKWCNRYSALYIIGASGKIFWEKNGRERHI